MRFASVVGRRRAKGQRARFRGGGCKGRVGGESRLSVGVFRRRGMVRAAPEEFRAVLRGLLGCQVFSIGDTQLAKVTYGIFPILLQAVKGLPVV